MSEFLLDIVKGLYPLYFFLMITGVIDRIRSRKWNHFDWFLLILFCVFEFLAAFQVFFFYRILWTSKRYLWTGLPLGLPFAAYGLLRLLKLSALEKLSGLICIVLIGMNIYNTYSPVFHGRHSTKKSTVRANSREAALWISNDWKNSHTLPFSIWKCDQYQSGKQPLVQSDFPWIGYLCGGQNYPEFFSFRKIMPDYIVSRSPVLCPDHVLVKEIGRVKIYKNRKYLP